MVSGYLSINADTEYGHRYRKPYQAELAYMVKPQHLTEAYKAVGSAPCSPLQPPLMEHWSTVMLQLPALTPCSQTEHTLAHLGVWTPR